MERRDSFEATRGAIEHPAHRILIATDFSDSADTAFTIAVNYARLLHARLHLLHVFSPGEFDVTRLLAATAEAGSDVPVTVTGAAGDPAEEILKYAAQHPIDLIVVGTHGRSGVSRVLLGSVAERVIRGARCPVLVVPVRTTVPARSAHSGTSAEGDDARPSAGPRCIVCATPTGDLICEPCRARIRGEALEHKQREERAGRR